MGFCIVFKVLVPKSSLLSVNTHLHILFVLFYGPNWCLDFQQKWSIVLFMTFHLSAGSWQLEIPNLVGLELLPFMAILDTRQWLEYMEDPAAANEPKVSRLEMFVILWKIFRLWVAFGPVFKWHSFSGQCVWCIDLCEVPDMICKKDARSRNCLTSWKTLRN